MGNIFDGGTEDLLLYGAIPFVLVTLTLAIAILGAAVARRFRLHQASWIEKHAPTAERDRQYRMPAATQSVPMAPTSVVLTAQAAQAWGVGIGAFWLLTSCVLALGVGEAAGLVLAFATASLGAVVCWALARASLAMGDRDDTTVIARIERARLWLLLHHVLLLMFATLFMLLFVASNQFFWNATDDGRLRQLRELAAMYALFVVVPSALGLWLWRGLGSVCARYRPTE